jgi:aspartate aminotransferase
MKREEFDKIVASIKTPYDLTPGRLIGLDGSGVISFGAGQPDLPPPKEILDVRPRKRDQKYGNVIGLEELRDELTKEPEFKGSRSNNFIITVGASEALDLVMRALTKPDDKILLHSPYYYSYYENIKNNYRIPIITETVDGKIDLNDFEDKIQDCKLFFLNSPGNPTGRVQSKKTLKEIERITQELDIPIISDEVYKDLIYTRENYMMKGPHIVTINSFSKTFGMCGGRIGYMYSNDNEIINKCVDIKTNSTMNTSIYEQRQALVALKVPRKEVLKQVPIWEERRNLIYNGLKELGFGLWKPEGAFYVFPKIDNPRQVCFDLLSKYSIVTYLGEWFGDPDRLRFSYALDKSKIKEGLKRIGNYLATK